MLIENPLRSTGMSSKDTEADTHSFKRESGTEDAQELQREKS